MARVQGHIFPNNFAQGANVVFKHFERQSKTPLFSISLQSGSWIRNKPIKNALLRSIFEEWWILFKKAQCHSDHVLEGFICFTIEVYYHPTLWRASGSEKKKKRGRTNMEDSTVWRFKKPGRVQKWPRSNDRVKLGILISQKRGLDWAFI